MSTSTPSTQIPFIRPRDAASLILIDRATPDAPRILMGQRSARHAFMAGVFVFPGGGVDRHDGRLALGQTEISADDKLLSQTNTRITPARTRALKLAAIRECYEETGYIIATRAPFNYRGTSPAWQAFSAGGFRPDPSVLTFVARAITPPGRVRRFDARFFTTFVDAEQTEKSPPLTDELQNIGWYTIDEIRQKELARITRGIIEDLAGMIIADTLEDGTAPRPFYYRRHGKDIKTTL